MYHRVQRGSKLRPAYLKIADLTSVQGWAYECNCCWQQLCSLLVLDMATLLQTVCPTPFLSLGDFPYTAGCTLVSLLPLACTLLKIFQANDSRVCAPSPLGKAMCCLPCPLTDWVYPDSRFNTSFHFKCQGSNSINRFQRSIKCRKLDRTWKRQ